MQAVRQGVQAIGQEQPVLFPVMRCQAQLENRQDEATSCASSPHGSMRWRVRK